MSSDLYDLICILGVQQFVARMAMVVATEVNMLDPDYILIGCGVPNMTGFPKETLVEHI